MKQLTILALFCISTICFAGASKIAVIDMEKVYTSYYKTQAQSARFDKQKAVYKAYSMKLKNEIEELNKEYKVLLDESQNISLKDNIRKGKAAAADSKRMTVRSKEQEIVQYNRSKYEELQTKSAEMREGIIKEIRNVVREKSILDGYHLVLDISSKGLSGVESVVYYSSYIDLTKSIIEKLNKTKQSE